MWGMYLNWCAELGRPTHPHSRPVTRVAMLLCPLLCCLLSGLRPHKNLARVFVSRRQCTTRWRLHTDRRSLQMDPFALLTSGLKFDRSRFASDINRFKPGAAQHNAAGSQQQAAITSAPPQQPATHQGRKQKRKHPQPTQEEPSQGKVQPQPTALADRRPSSPDLRHRARQTLCAVLHLACAGPGIDVFGKARATQRHEQADPSSEENEDASDELGEDELSVSEDLGSDSPAQSSDQDEDSEADSEDESDTGTDEEGDSGDSGSLDTEAAALANGRHTGHDRQGAGGADGIDPDCPVVATRDVLEAANVVRKHYRIKVGWEQVPSLVMLRLAMLSAPSPLCRLRTRCHEKLRLPAFACVVSDVVFVLRSGTGSWRLTTRTSPQLGRDSTGRSGRSRRFRPGRSPRAPRCREARGAAT